MLTTNCDLTQDIKRLCKIIFIESQVFQMLLVAGLNCLYDLDTVLKTLKRMKAALDKEGLSPYLMCQPMAWRCPEVEDNPLGYCALDDFPLSKLHFKFQFYMQFTIFLRSTLMMTTVRCCASRKATLRQLVFLVTLYVIEIHCANSRLTEYSESGLSSPCSSAYPTKGFLEFAR